MMLNFSGYVPAYQNNFVTADFYRGITNAKWRINFAYNEEGHGTYMTFWLEKSNYNNVSPAHDIKVESGCHTFYDASYRGNVHLTAENNNYSSKINYITGMWSEE